MIAVTNNLISSVVTDLDTDCDILWVQIDLIGTKSLHIGSFYRPPNSDMTALDNLNLSLERLTHRTNGNIWLGGDFNAPVAPLNVKTTLNVKNPITAKCEKVTLNVKKLRKM